MAVGRRSSELHGRLWFTRAHLQWRVDVRASAGDLIGWHAVVLRAHPAMTPAWDADAFVGDLTRRDGVARVQLGIRSRSDGA